MECQCVFSLLLLCVGFCVPALKLNSAVQIEFVGTETMPICVANDWVRTRHIFILSIYFHITFIYTIIMHWISRVRSWIKYTLNILQICNVFVCCNFLFRSSYVVFCEALEWLCASRSFVYDIFDHNQIAARSSHLPRTPIHDGLCYTIVVWLAWL